MIFAGRWLFPLFSPSASFLDGGWRFVRFLGAITAIWSARSANGTATDDPLAVTVLSDPKTAFAITGIQKRIQLFDVAFEIIGQSAGPTFRFHLLRLPVARG